MYETIKARLEAIAGLADRLLKGASGRPAANAAGLSRSAFLEKRAAEFEACGDPKMAANYRATAALVRKCRPAPLRSCCGEED